MTHLKVLEEIQDGGSLVRRKTTVFRLIFVYKIKSKSSFIGFKRFIKSLFVVQSDFFIPTRIPSITCDRNFEIGEGRESLDLNLQYQESYKMFLVLSLTDWDTFFLLSC